MNALEVIDTYGAPVVCRAVHEYMAGRPWDTIVPDLDECEFIGEVLAVMTVAHSALSEFEQARYARILSELQSLTLIEDALIREGSSAVRLGRELD